MTETAKNEQEMPELLSLKEASEILKCHPNTLRQWDKKGILVAVRFGERKDRRYRKEDILKLLNQKKRWWHNFYYNLSIAQHLTLSSGNQIPDQDSKLLIEHSWSGQ